MARNQILLISLPVIKLLSQAPGLISWISCLQSRLNENTE
jgi:hypothetical protein